jgi:hypothetical protein
MNKKQSGLGKKRKSTRPRKRTTARNPHNNSSSRRRTQSTQSNSLDRRRSTTLKKQPISPRVTGVLSKMRSGISLRKAAREAKVSPRTVLKRAGSALRKNKSGRYAAKPSDRLVRPILVPTPEGPREIEVRGLREAGRVGRYWAALQKYYEVGDASNLRKFSGQSITDTNGAQFPLITDLSILDRLGSAGVVSFESIYSWSEQ